ncbi:MAG TPA: ATP-dependent Clp protease ATP-binding subunit ClpX, partial [Cryomorphaceae bacterium]|nr:ATP-dependent Clp protease ATP-binding subunit ClpX [Cryomorphaceae bacterium]
TRSVGFHSSKDREDYNNSNLLRYIAPQDLKTFGLIPELIGRMPVLTYLNPLDEATLELILTKPKNAILKQYTKLLELDGVTLDFSEEALKYVVQKAIEFKLGARGLRSIIETILTDAMFELPSNDEEQTLTVDRDYASQKMEKMSLKALKAVS